MSATVLLTLGAHTRRLPGWGDGQSGLRVAALQTSAGHLWQASWHLASYRWGTSRFSRGPRPSGAPAGPLSPLQGKPGGLQALLREGSSQGLERLQGRQCDNHCTTQWHTVFPGAGDVPTGPSGHMPLSAQHKVEGPQIKSTSLAPALGVSKSGQGKREIRNGAKDSETQTVTLSPATEPSESGARWPPTEAAGLKTSRWCQPRSGLWE